MTCCRRCQQQLDIPYVDLSTFELKPELAKRLPETDARRFRALVLKETAQGLLVAMGDPTDIFGYDELVRHLKQPIQLAAVKEDDLLQSHRPDLPGQHASCSHWPANSARIWPTTPSISNKLIAVSSKSDAPVVRLIQNVFETSVSSNSSDIHIEPDEDVLRIRRRIDGVLHEQIIEDKKIITAMVSRLKLMADADISEHRLPQDGRFSLNVSGKNIDVRLSTIPTQYGEAVVMRLLDHGNAIPGLEELGMPDGLLESFRKIIHKPHGLVLVTGPTGSGKTTTLYAALRELNTPQKKIITIEDPVEYRLQRVNQVQVNSKIGLDFARVLRTALRLDPDVILIGEMRDQETAEIGLRGALTGHLVLSTLHTNDAISSATRLIDMGLAGYLVASSVQAILAQRLIRRVCKSCSASTELDANELRLAAQPDRCRSRPA